MKKVLKALLYSVLFLVACSLLSLWLQGDRATDDHPCGTNPNEYQANECKRLSRQVNQNGKQTPEERRQYEEDLKNGAKAVQ